MFYVLALPVLAASKSTGILLGFFVFTILAVLYELYRIGCKKGCISEGMDLGNLYGSAYIWFVFYGGYGLQRIFDVKTGGL